MSRPFDFAADKAIQATAFLLRREPGRRMNFMRLLKMLYLAERDILAESGKPLTGSKVVASPRGPVLEEVLQLVRGQHLATPTWSRYFRVDRYQLEMTEDPGVGKLSRFVTAKLDEIARRFDALDEWDMVEVMHELPEWQRNFVEDATREIPLRDILDAIGRGGDYDRIVAGAQRDARIASIMSPEVDEPTELQHG